MQFSNFSRVENGNKVIFSTPTPLKGIKNIKYYKDNSSGNFEKKEFRWSFDGNYWASWEILNQGNISAIDVGTNVLLFLEIRYVSSGNGVVTSFILHYNGAAQIATSEGACPPDNNYTTENKTVTDPYEAGCNTASGSIDAATLCGKPCDYYLWRPNHKGEQPISTITDLQKILQNLTNQIGNSITGAQNVEGDGIGVFYQKVNQDLFFKRIAAGQGAEVTESDGIISISVDSSIINKDPSVNELYQFYYDLESELNDLSIYVDQKFIAIDNSINELYALDASSIKGVSNIGGGTGNIFKQISGSVAELRTIAAGNANVVVETVGDQVRISLDASISGAPIWSDPDPISADVGSWVGGDDVSIGANSIEILEKMLYEYFPPNVNLFLDPSSGYYEKWVWTPVDISTYGDFNNNSFVKNEIHDASLYVNGTGVGPAISYPDVSSGSFSWTSTIGISTWTDSIYNVKIYHKNYTEMTPTDVSAEIKFVNAYYHSIVPNTVTASNITEAQIKAMPKLIVPEQSNEILYDNSLGLKKIKFVYAYDASYGDLTSIFDVKNDFNVTTSFDQTIVNLNGVGASPGPIPYKVYIKSHWIDVSTFKLIFNI